MTIDQFKKNAKLSSRLEVEKVCYLACFHLMTNNVGEFTSSDGARWLVDAGYANPNRSRLEQNLRASRNTIRSGSGWRLAQKFLEVVEKEIPDLLSRSQEVIDDGTILPEPDYISTRDYIQSISKQINACYEHNVFDGCAVLIRRLVEILLILSYKELGIDGLIKDESGNYYMLDRIIKDAKANQALALSRNSKTSLETFRTLGNFSAHKIEYTCRREYLRPHIIEFRALIGELLHKAGIRK